MFTVCVLWLLLMLLDELPPPPPPKKCKISKVSHWGPFINDGRTRGSGGGSAAGKNGEDLS